MPVTSTSSSQQQQAQASTSASAAAAAASQPTSLAKPQVASRVTSPDDGRRDRREPQLYVWVVTINRDVTNEEFQRYLSAVDPSLRRALEASLGAGPQLASRARGLGTLRKIVADLLPRMLMTRQRIPNAGWRFARNSAGKWFIDSPPAASGRTVSKVMGFGLAERDSVIGMAFAQGYKQQVVNVGMDIVRIPDHVDNEEAETFIGSLMHKLAPEELSQIVPALPVEKKLSRLCIMLAVKEAYLKALGQPHGFDLSRIAVVINPGGRSTMSVDKQPVYGWEFRLFTTDIGVSPSVRAQQPAAASGTADVLDVRGRPTDPDPRSWRSASAGSSRVMAGAGPSGSVVDERVPPARLAPLSSGRLMGGAGPNGHEGPAPTATQTTMGRIMGLTRTSSAPMATGLRHAPSASTSFAGGAYRPGLSSASSSASSSSFSSSTSSASTATPTTRAYTPTSHSHVNGARPGISPPPLSRGTGSMPAVLQHPSHASSHGAGSGSGSYPASSSGTRLFAGQGPATSSSTSAPAPTSGLKPYTVASSTSSTSAAPSSHPRGSTSSSSLGSSRTAASSTTSLASTASSATTMASHSDEPRVVQERYQCATAMWRGWTDRTEVVFAERDRDEMTSWLQFLTVTALARSVGSGVRNDPAP